MVETLVVRVVVVGGVVVEVVELVLVVREVVVVEVVLLVVVVGVVPRCAETTGASFAAIARCPASLGCTESVRPSLVSQFVVST